MLNPSRLKPAPRRRTAQLSVQPVGAEMLVYDERNHQAFCLNQTAAAVWQLCDGCSSIDEIAAAARIALNAPVEAELVLLALHDLERDGLLATEPEHAIPAALSRRALVSQLGAGALLMLPAIAMIAAPKAAQAYNGCVDCVSPNTAGRRRGRSSGEDE